MVGFCSSPQFIEHDTGPHHPERPDRIRAIYRALHDTRLLRSADPFPDFRPDFGLHPIDVPPLVELSPTPADERWLLTVHPQQHVDRVKHLCAHGAVMDQGDTPTEPRSFETARLAVGAVLSACDAVMNGTVKRAFAAVRPPGHHAEPLRAMGFCLFSNVAIAARYLQQAHGLQHVAIVDFDVHHGNGTQAAVEDDPSILFISLHQHPSTCYPGSGFEWEVGDGPGRGYTMNIPFDPASGDQDYLRVIKSRVVPKLKAFGPQALLISAGFDGHRDDPLAQMELSEDGFEQMTSMLIETADRLCDGRVVSVLEGGYNLRALGRSVVRHLVALGAQTSTTGRPA